MPFNIPNCTMLTGTALAAAIREAIARKMAKDHVTKKDIANHFGIKAPSIYDWEEKGSIDKEKLPELWKYFSDVVDMTHWGLSAQDFACFGLVQSFQAKSDVIAYGSPRQRRIDMLLKALEPISDAGIEHLTSYAIWVASQYPKSEANEASYSNSQR